MTSNKFRMVYEVDGNPQLDLRDWSMYSNILKYLISSASVVKVSLGDVEGIQMKPGKNKHLLENWYCEINNNS